MNATPIVMPQPTDNNSDSSMLNKIPKQKHESVMVVNESNSFRQSNHNNNVSMTMSIETTDNVAIVGQDKAHHTHFPSSIDRSLRENESLNSTPAFEQPSSLLPKTINYDGQNIQTMESFDELLKRHYTYDSNRYESYAEHQKQESGTFQRSDGSQDMQSTVRFFNGDETSTLA